LTQLYFSIYFKPIMPEKMVIQVAECLQFQGSMNIDPQKRDTGSADNKKYDRELPALVTALLKVPVIQKPIQQQYYYSQCIQERKTCQDFEHAGA
jgi:hypothetical protein